jgi:5-methylcytosine-specific restriction endonuclease McrA
MSYERRQRETIYRRTDGYCHICHKKLALGNYGRTGSRGAWHVDHSLPRAHGGSDHGNNLFAACVSCNTSKRDGSTKSARSKHGKSRAPYSPRRKAEVRGENVLAGAAAGAASGALVGGPPGAVIGGLLGALCGGSRRVV